MEQITYRSQNFSGDQSKVEGPFNVRFLNILHIKVVRPKTVENEQVYIRSLL